jgi:hypothetical protein
VELRVELQGLVRVCGVPLSWVTLDFNVVMSDCVVLSCLVAVAKAHAKVLFVFVRTETVLRSEAVAMARFPSPAVVWDWISLKVTELAA